MINRVIYPEAALWGGTPSIEDADGPAAREIAAIANEVQGLIDSMPQMKQAAQA
jgi:chromosome partitioning protein